MAYVKVTHARKVRTISLNRPEKRNAFGAEMIAELTAKFKEVAGEPDVRAVILKGEGASFCAGGDLEWMRASAKYSHAENLADAERLFELYWSIHQVPVPVIGIVHGHAFGGGAGLLAVCDIVAAETSTKISFSEVKWGLVPAVISPFVVERASGSAIREWFLTAKIFGAEEARAGGLVSFAGARAEVDKFVEDSLAAIVAAGPGAVRDAKALHQSYTTIDWTKVRARVTELIARRRASAEGQAGLSAFLEKRSPPWSQNDAPEKI